MRLIIKNLHSNEGLVIGVELSVILDCLVTENAEKMRIVRILEQYVRTNIFPSQALSIYIHSETDSPWIVALRDMNNVPPVREVVI